MRTGEGASLRPRPAGGQGGGQGGGRRGGGQGGGQQHRYNWNTPFILSVHNPGIVYIGAEMVFRSLKHGDEMKAISPELTLTKRGSATASPNRRAIRMCFGSAPTMAHLRVTRDGGREWKNVNKNVGLPGPFWVSTIEASRFAEGRAYVLLRCSPFQ